MEDNGLLDPKFWRDEKLHSKLKMSFEQIQKITDKWGYIRQIYMEKVPDIIEASRQDITAWIDPYFIDWILHFTPIEDIAWNSIRPRMPMYP